MRTPNACSSPSLAAATSTSSASGPPAEAAVTSRLLISSTKQEPILLHLTSRLASRFVRRLLAFAHRSGSVTLNAVRRIGGDSFFVVRRVCSRFARRSFPHVNLGAPTLKRDFIHHELHQMDAATVLRFQPFRDRRIVDGSGVKSISMVLNDQPDSLSSFAPAANLN